VPSGDVGVRYPTSKSPHLSSLTIEAGASPAVRMKPGTVDAQCSLHPPRMVASKSEGYLTGSRY
jgi:hypothetical protein